METNTSDERPQAQLHSTSRTDVPPWMVEYIPPPEPEVLLPPLLACLPTAFVSTRPPPALLPLLSPILRQRVQLLSSVAASPSDSWLRLLSWSDEKAERVSRLLDGVVFEPHPASGEIEVPEDLSITYKRLDEETLRSKLSLPEYQLNVLYVWCSNDADSGGPGWRIAELEPCEGPDDNDTTWSETVSEANIQARERIIDDALRDAEADRLQVGQKDGDEDEDDYWAQYDNTPGRTPYSKTPVSRMHHPTSGVSEDAYFSQYADVQPAMDNHDPSENTAEAGESSLNGDIFAKIMQQARESRDAAPRDPSLPQNNEHADLVSMMINHPRPSSASSGSAVAKLEQEAENRSTSEIAIKQHIGSSIKSLYRLAKTTGMPRAEFQNLIRTEIDLLSLSDDD
ncbi:conserved hypothetical protein [Talaromyces stipitatus ATCC 10500]|uniref:Uncharacterized protein n=1 Tax=Talaromyces stipitatus (strain ATCC 10500 / CBS 375.48 / QM 6759 / NRRL 1006) TaxID=441959 RepID=B8ME00_TALSN|nr:uncharacterized protein TSTA_011860 [Talaromyces stipitatus ATCC 10500]EED16077.1 conserved hypothetical protein [Talaromyces stipitatus ATCC 10500]